LITAELRKWLGGSAIQHIQCLNALDHESANTGRSVAIGTKFSAVAPSVVGPQYGTVRVTLLVPRILRWLVVFWKSVCTPVLKNPVTDKIMNFKVATNVLRDVTACSFVNRYQL
jgi:hypothetical protein